MRPNPKTFLKMDHRGVGSARGIRSTQKALASFKAIGALQIEPIADEILELLGARRHKIS